MAGKLYLEVAADTLPGNQLAYGGGPATSGPEGSHSELVHLSTLLLAIASGDHRGFARVRTDDSTGVAATLAVTVDYDDFTLGDKLVITIPGVQPLVFSAIVSGTAAYGSGVFAAVTSDNQCAANLRDAINQHPRAARAGITATASSAVVTVSAPAGSAGNAIAAAKFVTTSTAIALGAATFAGGHDPGVLSVSTLALSGALTVNDTVTIGGVVLTAVASPANESQFVGAVSAAADGAALVACINAHSELKGIVLASGTSTVTLTCQLSGRVGTLITVAKSAAAITLTGANFAPLTTDVWATSMVHYGLGFTPA